MVYVSVGQEIKMAIPNINYEL